MENKKNNLIYRALGKVIYFSEKHCPVSEMGQYFTFFVYGQ